MFSLSRCYLGQTLSMSSVFQPNRQEVHSSQGNKPKHVQKTKELVNSIWLVTSPLGMLSWEKAGQGMGRVARL